MHIGGIEVWVTTSAPRSSPIRNTTLALRVCIKLIAKLDLRGAVWKGVSRGLHEGSPERSERHAYICHQPVRYDGRVDLGSPFDTAEEATEGA